MEGSHEFQSFVLYVCAVFSFYKISLLFLLHHIAFSVAFLLLFYQPRPYWHGVCVSCVLSLVPTCSWGDCALLCWGLPPTPQSEWISLMFLNWCIRTGFPKKKMKTQRKKKYYWCQLYLSCYFVYVSEVNKTGTEGYGYIVQWLKKEGKIFSWTFWYFGVHPGI